MILPIPFFNVAVFPSKLLTFWRLTSAAAAKSLQLCLTLFDPTDSSPLGSSAHGILQARLLEWVAISSSSRLPDPRIKPTFPALQAGSLSLSHLGSPVSVTVTII